jgi:DNA-binding CsgD family transcriptional regulator
LTSLDEAAPMTGPDDVGEPLVLHDVLSRDEEDPATKAARKLDWQTFMAGLSARDRAIIGCLVEGKPLASLARRRHLNNSTLLYHKERLALKIQAYMGADILIQIRRKPNWKDSLDASRERLACREERRHL